MAAHSAKQKASFNSPDHLRFGLSLPATLLKGLQKRGIYCAPGVSLEHQHRAKRYVLRGVESGGTAFGTEDDRLVGQRGRRAQFRCNACGNYRDSGQHRQARLANCRQRR